MKQKILAPLATFCILLGVTECSNDNKTGESVGDKIENAADTIKAAVNDMTDKDKDFVSDVLKANHGEILLLQAGIDNGTNKSLKTHAGHMLADHQKLESWLKEFSAKKGWELPEFPSTTDDLGAKPGADWDKAWADKMVSEHEATIGKFERNQNDMKDSELQTMIMNTLPTLRSHLEMAKELQAKLK